MLGGSRRVPRAWSTSPLWGGGNKGICMGLSDSTCWQRVERGGRTSSMALLGLAPLFKCVEIIYDEVVSEKMTTRRCVGESLWYVNWAYELSTIWKAQAISMLRTRASSKISMPGTPSPDVTELSTNPAPATIYIAAFPKRPNLRKTGGAMVMASRMGDLEFSILSRMMCSNRMESVTIGVTLLSIPIITTVRGSRVVEGESHEHSC